MGSRVWSVILVLAAVFHPRQAESQSYYCEAQGVYSVCVTDHGVETCEDRVATGGAAGAARGDAETNAFIDCTTNLTSAVQRGNWPTGSSDRSERAFTKQNCAVTSCKDYGSASSPQQPAPSGPVDNAEIERLMAEGDQLYVAGDRESAALRWHQASLMAPDRPEPYLRINMAFLVSGRYQEACQVVDCGLPAAGPSTGMKLAAAECAIYRAQYGQAEAFAVEVMEKEPDADFRLAANLLGWLASSLESGAMVPCANFATTLGQRSQVPAWDLGPLVAFLASNQPAGAAPVVALLDRLRTAGVAAAADFKAACGG